MTSSSIDLLREAVDPHSLGKNRYARYMSSSLIIAYTLAYINIYTEFFPLMNSIFCLYVFPILSYLIWIIPYVFMCPKNLYLNKK
jgi:hypothetical protein